MKLIKKETVNRQPLTQKAQLHADVFKQITQDIADLHDYNLPVTLSRRHIVGRMEYWVFNQYDITIKDNETSLTYKIYNRESE